MGITHFFIHTRPTQDFHAKKLTGSGKNGLINDFHTPYCYYYLKQY